MRDRKVRKPIVSIARKETEQSSIQATLDQLPMEAIVKEGDRVVITPNWVSPKSPQTADVIGPETLRAIIRYIKKYKPKDVIAATGSGGDTKQVFETVGYRRVIHEEGVLFVDLNYGPYTELDLDHEIIKSTKINKLIDDLDVLISFCQLKLHDEATMTASIKNVAMGWPPGEIHGFPKKQLGIHDDLHGFIAAMAKKLPIDLSIISVDKAMIGTGPHNGIAVDTKGLVIVSTDPVAADTIGARLLGFKPQAIHYLYSLGREGFGETDTARMDLRGLPLHEAERIFSMAAYGREIILDPE